VIEGRGYGADGGVTFNAFGIISYSPATSAFTMTSWAQGSSGVFPFRPTADGYAWEIPAGPGATIRYSATVRDGTLREVGYLVAGNAPPRQIFEMNLRRVGDTDWPAADPVPMR
jgi:acyl dehydratase